MNEQPDLLQSSEVGPAPFEPPRNLFLGPEEEEESFGPSQPVKSLSHTAGLAGVALVTEDTERWGEGG